MRQIKSRLFSQAQIDWLEKNYNTVLVADLTAMFNKEFNSSFTKKQVYQFCRTNWGNSVFNGMPNKGQFKQGDKPWHAGTRGTGVHKGTLRTRRTAEEYFESIAAKEGETRVDINGLTWLKVGGEWVIKHRHLYSKHHGVELGHDDIIIFRDGDNRNFQIENLVHIDRRTHSALVGNNLKQYDGDLLGAAILTAKLLMEVRAKELK